MPPPAKNVLLYARVSTDEQADRGYSLPEQHARLKSHAEREGLRVAGAYTEDASAQSFERPQLKRLLEQAKALKPCQILFTRWDRFSRDETEARTMIKALRTQKIEPVAIEQPIDWSIPEQKYLLGLYLTSAEVETDRLSMRVTAGMRRAQLEGRWVHAAPFGYRNSRGEDNRPRLDIVPEKAALVLEAFELAATRPDLPLDDIRKRLRPRGLKVSGSQFHRMLGHIVYTGRIDVAASGDDPARIVEALHEAIVPVPLFDAVQNRMGRRVPGAAPRRSRGAVHEGLELRGHLVCPACGSRLTGSFSRGRHGGRYGYYHCVGRSEDGGRGTSRGHARHAAERVNGAFVSALAGFSPSPARIALYREVLADLVAGDEAKRAATLRRLRADLATARQRLDQADDMLVEGTLPSDTYARVRVRYQADVDDAVRRIGEMEALELPSDVVAFVVELLAPERGGLAGAWQRATPEGRAALGGSIWPLGLDFDGTRFGTLFSSELIAVFAGKMPEMKEAPPVLGEALPVWRARRDSNPWPSEPESDALSS